MVMNAQEIQKETEKYASKRVLNNVEYIFQHYISDALKNGYGSVKHIQYDFEMCKDIGEEEIKYMEALGYSFFKLKTERFNGVKYIITWTPKEEQRFRAEVEKEKYICQRNKKFFYVLVISFIITLFLSVFILPMFWGPAIKIGGILLFIPGYACLMNYYREKVKVSSKYLYISPKK